MTMMEHKSLSVWEVKKADATDLLVKRIAFWLCVIKEARMAIF